MQIRKFKVKKKGKVIEYNVAIPENFAECAQCMEEHEAYKYLLVGYLEMQKRVALGTMPKQKKFIKIPVEGLTQQQMGVLAQLGLVQTLPGEPVPLPQAPPAAPEPQPAAADFFEEPVFEDEPSVETTPQEIRQEETVTPQDEEEVLEVRAPEKTDEEWEAELGISRSG
jgi:hypothetical protein